ncbi:MAG: hypothetical protein EBX13_01695, partial [Proteobacteria bacterium]|nr:hypothetical protein [Pseudomonadota bacterium]
MVRVHPDPPFIILKKPKKIAYLKAFLSLIYYLMMKCNFLKLIIIHHLVEEKCYKSATSESFEIQETGAGNEVRTRDLNLGKVALYQL